MKKLDVVDVLGALGGSSAVVQGPFLVFDLTNRPEQFRSLEVGQHGMEEVPSDRATEPHDHDFVSAYKAEDLNVSSGEKVYELPARAVVLVMPKISHSWRPKHSTGRVGSADTTHEKQALQKSA